MRPPWGPAVDILGEHLWAGRPLLRARPPLGRETTTVTLRILVCFVFRGVLIPECVAPWFTHRNPRGKLYWLRALLSAGTPVHVECAMLVKQHGILVLELLAKS